MSAAVLLVGVRFHSKGRCRGVGKKAFAKSPPSKQKRGEHFREPLTKRASFFRKPSSGRGSLFRKPLTERASLSESPRQGGNGRYRITSKPKQNKEGCLFRKPFYRGLSLPKAPVGSKGWHFGGSPLVRRACFLGSPLRKTGLAFPKALSEKKWALSLGSPPKKKGSLFSKARAHFW